MYGADGAVHLDKWSVLYLGNPQKVKHVSTTDLLANL